MSRSVRVDLPAQWSLQRIVPSPAQISPAASCVAPAARALGIDVEYTKAGGGARLAMLVLHDDATREYAYGPAQELPATKVDTFSQALYDQAKKAGWIVIMKSDWKRVFASE